MAHEEAGEGGEHEKPKQEEKPRPDSEISSVMALPVVKEWQTTMTAKNDGTSITVWGEALKTVDDDFVGSFKCGGVAVGKTTGDKTITWKRFCVTPGGKVWVESAPDPKTDEISYSTYDDWVAKCKPTSDSPGNC